MLDGTQKLGVHNQLSEMYAHHIPYTVYEHVFNIANQFDVLSKIRLKMLQLI